MPPGRTAACAVSAAHCNDWGLLGRQDSAGAAFSDGNILISTCLGKGFWHLRHTKNCTCRNHQPSSDSDAFCSQLLVSASAAALYPQTLEGDYCVGN